MKVIKAYLDYLDQKTNALIFMPSPEGMENAIRPVFAVFTHGYTADKSSLLNWAIRLGEMGVPVIIFDLPGHYQGNFSEVQDFEHFKNHAHELFVSAFYELKKVFLAELPFYEPLTQKDQLKLVLGGHSLGAMLSLKALTLKEFVGFEKLVIAVGLGMAPQNVVHIFDTPFYKATMKIREQLVSPALKGENVFPWIKEEKESLSLSGHKIHLIVGEDDLVVGNNGLERFSESLIQKGNTVTTEKPTRLPHHEPQLAAGHVKKYLKKINWV